MNISEQITATATKTMNAGSSAALRHLIISAVTITAESNITGAITLSRMKISCDTYRICDYS